MKKTICLFLTFACTVPVLSCAANPNFQEGQTTSPQMQQYFEGRKAEYNQYLADLAAYNQAVAYQQAWDSQTLQEDKAQQETQANLQAAINQKSEECSQCTDPAEQQACQQTVTDMQIQMFDQAAQYEEYRRDRLRSRPVVGRQPTFHDNTAELAKAYIFDENEVLKEKVHIVGARNMKDERGRSINNEGDVRAYYERQYGER